MLSFLPAESTYTMLYIISLSHFFAICCTVAITANSSAIWMFMTYTEEEKEIECQLK